MRAQEKTTPWARRRARPETDMEWKSYGKTLLSCLHLIFFTIFVIIGNYIASTISGLVLPPSHK
jgi:hypothetical protein